MIPANQNVLLANGITVLICTHNGANNMPATLTHLAAQKVTANLTWEIIIVNNASTDNTAQVIVNTWSKLNTSIPLTIYNEPNPGKDNAIDLGLNSAKYKFVIICDDDNWLSDNYIQDAYTIMQQNPEIGLLGGKGIPEFETTPPKWFEGNKVYYAVGEQSSYNGEIKHYWPSYRFIWGAGIIDFMQGLNP